MIASREVPLKGDRTIADTRSVRRLLLPVTATAVLCCLLVRPAIAGTGEASFALNPFHYDPALRATKSYFVAVAPPGATIENSVRVINTGTRTGTAYLYAVDATTGQTSGAVYFDRRIPRRDVGAWISLQAQAVTLAPNESKVISFVVHVPRDARPGDHLGGIVAENAQLTQASAKGALQIKIRHLTIVAVEVQVPGPPVVGFEVSGVRAGGEHGYQDMYIHFRNLGTLTMKPVGTLLVSNPGGKVVAVRHFRLDTFLPRTEIDYPLLLPRQALSPGHYEATVKVSYGSRALGYRRSDGSVHRLSRSFSFNVSADQYATVFKGVAPVTKPAATPRSGSTLMQLLPWIVAAMAVLLAAVAFLVTVTRRWSPLR
jgi:hypothetical protein